MNDGFTKGTEDELPFLRSCDSKGEPAVVKLTERGGIGLAVNEHTAVVPHPLS